MLSKLISVAATPRKLPIKHKLIGIGSGNGVNATEPELLYKTILKYQKCTFHTAFGRTGIGANSLYVQFLRCTVKLGIAVTTGRVFIVNSEYAGRAVKAILF